MKFLLKFTLFLIVVLTVFSCADHEPKTFENTLTEEQTAVFLYQISRYIVDLPKRGDHNNKFDASFDEHYRKGVDKYNLEYYHTDESGHVYFMLTRIAPSVQEKYVALGGKFQPSEADTLNNYEEVFRTWKMTREEMEPKVAMLFEKMVNGEDLSPYYTMNSGNTDYIEFPDAETSYNKELRVWESSREDVLAPYRPTLGQGGVTSPQTDSTDTIR